MHLCGKLSAFSVRERSDARERTRALNRQSGRILRPFGPKHGAWIRGKRGREIQTSVVVMTPSPTSDTQVKLDPE